MSKFGSKNHKLKIANAVIENWKEHHKTQATIKATVPQLNAEKLMKLVRGQNKSITIAK